jgi:hypothetical protein
VADREFRKKPRPNNFRNFSRGLHAGYFNVKGYSEFDNNARPDC